MFMVIYVCLCNALSLFCSHGRASKGGYACPRCACKVCSIPSDCPVCQLTLISSSHLARSYHHLFPVPAFEDVDIATDSTSHCYTCNIDLMATEINVRHKCSDCKQVFCTTCDAFIHDNLHNCPGCLSSTNS